MTAASIPLSLNNISQEKMLHLKKHPRLLEALDQWVLFADRRLIPEMRELGQIVNKLYDFPKELRLYRGFRLGSFQDNLGVDGNSHIGQISTYQTDECSLSFSTNEQIAQAFGNVVVSTTIQTQRSEFLYITDELVVLIHEARNLKQFMNQHEVILLPPMTITLKVQQFEKGFTASMRW
jgi:hypothetical protein